MKIAVIDLDNVIVDGRKRFEVATEGGKIVWEKALSSELLYLDERMPDAVKHLDLIRANHDQVILLTSRYDHMRQASLTWLSEHGITQYDRAIFKPWDDRYTKTKLWKAQQVVKILQEMTEGTLWQSQQNSITHLLIIDDEEANRVEIQQEVARWIISHRQMRAYYFVDLPSTANAIEHTTIYSSSEEEIVAEDTDFDELDIEDHPF